MCMKQRFSSSMIFARVMPLETCEPSSYVSDLIFMKLGQYHNYERVDVHKAEIFRFNDFCKSYAPRNLISIAY